MMTTYFERGPHPFLVWIGENGSIKKTSYTVVSINVFERIKTFTLLYKSALLWTGENNPRTLVKANILSSVFVDTKADTFKNA